MSKVIAEKDRRHRHTGRQTDRIAILISRISIAVLTSDQVLLIFVSLVPLIQFCNLKTIISQTVELNGRSCVLNGVETR